MATLTRVTRGRRAGAQVALRSAAPRAGSEQGQSPGLGGAPRARRPLPLPGRSPTSAPSAPGGTSRPARWARGGRAARGARGGPGPMDRQTDESGRRHGGRGDPGVGRLGGADVGPPGSGARFSPTLPSEAGAGPPAPPAPRHRTGPGPGTCWHPLSPRPPRPGLEASPAAGGGARCPPLAGGAAPPPPRTLGAEVRRGGRGDPRGRGRVRLT